MSVHTITGYITHETSNYDPPVVRFSMYKPSPKYSPNEVIVAEHSFDYEIPDSFDPVPGIVAALEEQKRIARAALAAELRSIDKRISELQCIEHTAVAEIQGGAA